MKISERRAAFVKALHVSFGRETISVKAICPRLAGLALKEPANSALLQAIAANVGRNVHHHRLGQLLSSCDGKRFGSLELQRDGTVVPKRYVVCDHDNILPLIMPKARRVGSIEKALELEAERNKIAEDDRRDAEREAIRADPAAHNAYHAATGHWIGKGTNLNPPEAVKYNLDGTIATAQPFKCGADGKPEPAAEPELPPVTAAAPTPKAPKARRLTKDARPPWMRRGESKPRDKAEWLRWQARRGSAGDSVVPGRVAGDGFSDPGGVVAHNMNAEYAPVNLGTLWNRTFEGL